MSTERDELARQLAEPGSTSVRLRKNTALRLLQQFDDMLATLRHVEDCIDEGEHIDLARVGSAIVSAEGR